MSGNQNNGQPFSFLEFNEVLNRQYVPQESDSKNNFFAPNQGQKLKFEPNMNVARIQGVDQPQSSQIQKNDQEKKVDLIQDSKFTNLTFSCKEFQRRAKLNRKNRKKRIKRQIE